MNNIITSHENFQDATSVWSEDWVRRYLTQESDVIPMLKIFESMVEAGHVEPGKAPNKELITSLNANYIPQATEILNNVTVKNVRRLKTLAKLRGLDILGLQDKKIISVGGGPGDKICDPWFPRFASLFSKNVTNFDITEALSIDFEERRFTHVTADVFDLIGNKEIFKFFEPGSLSIIECNNLLGNNISPTLAVQIQAGSEASVNPQIIKLRVQLREISRTLLEEEGVLAIDNVYYQKSADFGLVVVNDSGELTDSPFIDEQ